MKKLLGLTFCALTSFCLVACSGTSVEKEEFVKKAGEIEEHQYTSAKVTFYSKYLVQGFDAIFGMTGFDGDEEVSQTVEFTFSNGEWSPSEDLKSEDILEYVGMNLSEAVEDIAGMGEELENAKLNYYVNPFKVTLNASNEGEENGMKVKATEKISVTFDQYGFMTSLSSDMSESMSGKDSQGKALSASMLEKVSVKVSYKD